MGEHPAYIRKVAGSSPVLPTRALQNNGDVVQSGLRRWIVTPEIAGSNPVVPASAEVAQPVEHGPEKAGVPSSTLGLGTISFLLLAEKSCNERFVALWRASRQWNGVRVRYYWSAVLMPIM